MTTEQTAALVNATAARLLGHAIAMKAQDDIRLSKGMETAFGENHWDGFQKELEQELGWNTIVGLFNNAEGR